MPKPTGSRSMIKFLIIWIGQFLSSVGSGMTAFALGVCAFEKNGTASSVALVTPLSFLPSILLRPVGGLLADGGPLAVTVGRWVGTGQGRGIGLIVCAGGPSRRAADGLRFQPAFHPRTFPPGPGGGNRLTAETAADGRLCPHQCAMTADLTNGRPTANNDNHHGYGGGPGGVLEQMAIPESDDRLRRTRKSG